MWYNINRFSNMKKQEEYTMNTGLTLLLEMLAIFVIVSLISFGKLAKWFFAPEHCVWLQRSYWFIVVVAAIAAIVQW